MDVTISVGSETIDGYLAVPTEAVSGPGPWPGVVVIQDAFGLGADLKAITERFATAGYVALAPNLFSRGGMFRCVKATFAAMMSGRGKAIDDIDAARAVLADRAETTDKIGIAGFCMGGAFALLMAARGFDASAPYYGRLPKDMSVLDGACPIVGSYGAKDPGLRGAAATLESALRERGVEHDVKEYPKSGHSFANRLPGQPVLRLLGLGYVHEDSEDAWRRVTAFFADHLR